MAMWLWGLTKAELWTWSLWMTLFMESQLQFPVPSLALDCPA
jgi:hypothetical protein